MRSLALAFGLLTLATFPTSSVSAQSAPDSVVLYNLGTTSTFQYGCFAPCLCPVFTTRSLQGTFELKHVGFDGLYENYDVTNVRWTSPDNTTNVLVTGSGHYRIGGEAALQKQMVLDLRFGSGPLQRFDSGLMAGGNDFPRIEIDVSLHQKTCFDSVLHIQAAPAPVTTTSAGSDASSPRAASIQITPNPFTRETTLALGLPSPSRVELSIYDAQGRLVRRVARGTWFPAGAQGVLWDGKREDGGECASGVYFVRGRIGEAALVQRIVKAR